MVHEMWSGGRAMTIWLCFAALASWSLADIASELRRIRKALERDRTHR